MAEFPAARPGFAVTPILRSFAVTFAICAMLLRAVLPAGWMPNPGPEGAGFVICSIDGLHHIPPRRDPGQSHEDEHGFACPFAAAAHLAPPQFPPMLPQPFATAGLVVVFPQQRAVFPVRNFGYTPRGPPASV